MSILIKGMEMPEAGQTITIAVNWDGSLYARLEPVGGWCPLVSVPTPHGRLIDADVLKEKQQEDADLFKGSTDYGEKCRRDEALNAVANIVNAPTIIEAEADTDAK